MKGGRMEWRLEWKTITNNPAFQKLKVFDGGGKRKQPFFPLHSINFIKLISFHWIEWIVFFFGTMKKYYNSKFYEWIYPLGRIMVGFVHYKEKERRIV